MAGGFSLGPESRIRARRDIQSAFSEGLEGSMLDMRKCPNCSCTNPIALSLYKGNTILACQPGSQEEQNSQLHLTGGWTETSPAANTHTVTHKQTNMASHIWMQSDNQEDWHLHKQTVWHTFSGLCMTDSEAKEDYWWITFLFGKSKLWSAGEIG